MRRVLFVAYYFPPMGLSGVQRTLKFVRYLPRHNWLPTVLTVEPDGYFAHDDTLMDEIKDTGIRVVRTAPAGPAKFFAPRKKVRLPSEASRKLLSRLSDCVFVPDNKIGWRHRAVAKSMELHAEKPFDLVFATAPPFTDFLVGQSLKKYMKVPLVLDYRDPWVDYPFKFYPTPIHKWRNTSLERRVLRSSDHIVTTNRRVKELLISRYPFLSHHDIDIVPQGFDPADYEFDEKNQPVYPRRDKKLRITYAGVFWEDRVPDHFLRALHNLLRRQPELASIIEARFVGLFREENQKLVERLGLTKSVTVTGYLPHRECIRELMESDVLWMTVGDDLGSPGKTYEYIGTRKPILGCVPDGFIRSTILEAGGIVVPPTDVKGIENAILSFLEKKRKKTLPTIPDDIAEKYNRVGLTAQLAWIFESLLEV